MLHLKASSLKERQELQSLKQANEQLIIEKLRKKKIDLEILCEKSEFHNILNSFLHGNIYDEDLFNEFWEYYFKRGVKLKQIVKAYANTINILIQKIINTQTKINQLIKGKQKYKQNHDYKNINMATLLIQNLIAENNQYSNDLQEMSKPFSFHFKDLLAQKLSALKNSDEQVQNIQKSQNNNEIYLGLMADLIQKEKQRQQVKPIQQADDINLTNQEKYYRFITYLIIVVFIVQLSTAYNKYNIPNVRYALLQLIIVFILLLNSLFQQLVEQPETLHLFLQRIQINLFENRLEEVSEDHNNQNNHQNSSNQDEDLADRGKGHKKVRIHKFDNYANYLMISIVISLVQDVLWLILMQNVYRSPQSRNQTINLSFQIYNRYIIYATIFNTLTKSIILIFSFQLSDLKPIKLMSRLNVYLFVLRFVSIGEFKELFRLEIVK